MKKRFLFLLLVFAVSLTVSAQQNADSTTAVIGKNKKIWMGADSSLSAAARRDTALRTAAFDTVKTASSQSIKKPRKHSVGKAVLFSAVLPGLGQAYNKKYWKIPIVYAGFGGLSYAVYYNATNYSAARNAYRSQVDDNPATNLSYNGVSDKTALKEYRDFYRKNLELSGAFMGVWYILNLIDAAVDAHLFHYDVNDKLSMRLHPTSYPDLHSGSLALGGTFSLNF